ncbi:SH3 beta-barrel fold-containing protein [Spirosoma sp. 48-14]|uniref:SH3 beta-barrel fold-containing protein n=1 Tax=Spirosoma sp. 48-14 TaxID=1895854 RepID=UPI00095EB6BF|nr:SH3 beta-barrel fold-containing protein [Spirosoma sp. 48-14]OJW78428.1 MAG: hypothetical protein BGO59_30980 [Spirosoma sp. 48-14]
MKKSLFTLANFLRGKGFKSREAFKRAWAILRLRYKMFTEPVQFSYVKDTGEIREAIGFYGEEHAPKDLSITGLVIKYYDMTVGGWRSFRADRLIIA